MKFLVLQEEIGFQILKLNAFLYSFIGNFIIDTENIIGSLFIKKNQNEFILRLHNQDSIQQAHRNFH